MKKLLVGAMCASVFAFVVAAPVQAETTETTPTVASLMELLQSLIKQVEDLKKELQATQGEIQAVKSEIKTGLKEGVTDEDVKKIQELLASDTTLYPRGLITGYYGPMTSEAIKRFQERHGLTVTGIVDEETRTYLEEYYTEYKANRGATALWAQEKRTEMKKRIAERKAEHAEKKVERKEKTEDKKRTNTSITESVVKETIDDATTTINELEEALDGATAGEDAIDDATEDLDEAKAFLVKAERELANKKYRLANDFALKAIKSANEGLEELSETDDEDEDDDEEDEDEDDDSDEDEEDED